jgi:hypothetical protein
VEIKAAGLSNLLGSDAIGERVDHHNFLQTF